MAAPMGRSILETIMKKWQIKKATSLTVLFALNAISLAASAGASHGGGGGVINCEIKPAIVMKKDRDGKMKLQVEYDQKAAQDLGLSHGRKYQLTDLWEAEKGYGPFREESHRRGRNLNMMFDNKTTVQNQIVNALKRLAQVNPEFARIVSEKLLIVQQNVISIPEGSYVLPPQDTDIRYLKKGCEVVGLGMYFDIENNLVIDPEVKSSLLKIDEAAFFVHEAIYKALRDTSHVETSWSTRKMVGYLFSEESYTWEDLIR